MGEYHRKKNLLKNIEKEIDQNIFQIHLIKEVRIAQFIEDGHDITNSMLKFHIDHIAWYNKILPKIRVLSIFLSTLDETPTVIRFWWMNLCWKLCQMDNWEFCENGNRTVDYTINQNWPLELFDPICLGKLKKIFDMRPLVGQICAKFVIKSVCGESCCNKTN